MADSRFKPPAVVEAGSLTAVFSTRKIVRGAACLAMLTIVSLSTVFYITTTPQTFVALEQIDLQFIALAFVLQSADILLGAWRNYILVRRFRPEQAFQLCLRAQLANEFGAAITPGQSGGGPAWLFVLHRGGVPIPSALSVSVIVFLSTLLYFELSSALSFVFLDTVLTESALRLYVIVGFVVSTCLFGCILLVVSRPVLTLKVLDLVALRAGRASGKRFPRLLRLIQKLKTAAAEFSSRCHDFLRFQKLNVLKICLITGCYYFIKLNLAFVILLGLGASIEYWNALAVLALLRFILYFAPTPGGSGIGELGIAALMSAVLPIHLLPLYTVLYRAFHLYFPAGIGAYILIRELNRSARGHS